jgi:hypothetical protein
MMKTKTMISLIAALAVMAALATTAFAQSSVDGYSDSAGQIQTQVSGGGGGGTPPSGTAATATPVSDSSGGTLPFTGLDVALLVGAGGLLVVAGLGMRRLTRAPDAA